jgi:hypothetical protein
MARTLSGIFSEHPKRGTDAITCGIDGLIIHRLRRSISCAVVFFHLPPDKNSEKVEDPMTSPVMLPESDI